jgi:recombination protein RecT
MSQQLTIPEQRKNFLNLVQGENFKKQVALAIPKHLTPDRMLRIALTAMNKQPLLFECDPNTVLACIMDCAQMGLEPDGRNAYLIPFKDKQRGMICQLIVGYQGLIELAYRHPLVRGVRAKVVYEKDAFDYDEGLHPRLMHKPYDGEDDPGELKFAYAICDIGEGGHTFVVCPKRVVMKAKASSRGADSAFSPWTKFPDAMWMKTAVRRLAPFMPRASELAMALQVDDEQTSTDIQSTILPMGTIGAPQIQTPTEQAAAEANEGPPVAQGQAQAESETGPSAAELRKQLIAKGNESNIGKVKIQKTLLAMNYMSDVQTIDTLDRDALAKIMDSWEEIADKIKNPDEPS